MNHIRLSVYYYEEYYEPDEYSDTPIRGKTTAHSIALDSKEPKSIMIMLQKEEIESS